MIIATILRIFDTTLSALAALLLIEYETISQFYGNSCSKLCPLTMRGIIGGSCPQHSQLLVRDYIEQ